MFRRASYKSSSGWHAGACSDELSTNPAEAGMLRHVHTNPAEAGMLRHVHTNPAEAGMLRHVPTNFISKSS